MTKRDGRKDFCLGQIHFKEAGRCDFTGNHSSSLDLDLVVTQIFFGNAKEIDLTTNFAAMR